MKPTSRISWAGNLLMLLALTIGPSFKVKRWFTSFGELFPMDTNLHRFSDA